MADKIELAKDDMDQMVCLTKDQLNYIQKQVFKDGYQANGAGDMWEPSFRLDEYLAEIAPKPDFDFKTTKRFRFAILRLERWKESVRGATFSTKIMDNPDLYIEDLQLILKEANSKIGIEQLDEIWRSLYVILGRVEAHARQISIKDHTWLRRHADESMQEIRTLLGRVEEMKESIK